MAETEKLERGLGLVEATALNMTFMVGIGPFIVIPIIIKAMGGPQCLLAWVVGALLALLDGCIWAELGAAMPQAGGSYVFLREAYGVQRFGRLMSFLFIWQTLFQAPLSISSGALGFADYSKYLVGKVPALSGWLDTNLSVANYTRAVSLVLITLVVLLLYRRITTIGKISTAMWLIVLGTIGWLIYGGATHFDASRVVTYPAGTWSFSSVFFLGLGAATAIWAAR
jgi:amino acid transporter